MKKNTIKWRIFKYNLIIIFMLLALVAIIFNVAIRMYMEKDTLSQLNKIALRVEETTLKKGPRFLQKSGDAAEHDPPPPPNITETESNNSENSNNELIRFYFMLDRTLKESLSVINADYILFDSDKKRIIPSQEEFFKISDDLLSKIENEVEKSKNSTNETYLNFTLSGVKYIAIIKPVSLKNSFGLGWIVIYSNLQKISHLLMVINILLFIIIIFSAIIIVVFSSNISKKISAPFSSLNQHIRDIAERNFGNKINIVVDDELQDFVNNINIMSEKLETYDKAQKTFLQNVSHEFRTPIMSIQSYAEGIKYDVVDKNAAADIIIDESKRLTHLVEDLLYLSRLDAIEENYRYDNLDFNELINSCVERMNGIAIKNNIKINTIACCNEIIIYADEEKLARAITNIISNCIRYAKSLVEIRWSIVDKNKVKLIITDDGPGFEPNEISNIFERFYKGKKGNFGLGLSISKNVIERLNGSIMAENTNSGARFIIELPLDGGVK
ncbi:HAMP domain-containing histidine kinase [Caloramator sp. E03]|uniref:sensor histidine kinase n=1 Tax=Caloramator sp. E03 TaxID=2576307 RepID=UPI00111058F6|nr:HAMP domain-containing sensor histidine kinase [Caloramator sp. E03]QCX32846.1 HAMP domain-containing histidine kinase [Caloramator sp. E03]